MKVRVRGEWEDTLDPWRAPEQYLVECSVWYCVAPVDGDAFRPERSLRQLWNYRNIGTRQIVRKIRSRMRDQTFGTKFVSCGVGRIVAGPEGGPFSIGDDVMFIAPNHPQGATRVCLSAPWLRKTTSFHSASMLWRPFSVVEFESFAGWTRWSGHEVPNLDWAFDRVRKLIATPPTDLTETVRDSTPLRTSQTKRRTEFGKGIALFGFGHHARTNVVPNIPRPFLLRRVHDIDPCALIDLPHPDLDTSPFPTELPGCDVVLSCGYHHLHADVAYLAAQHGLPVVVEKPLFTSAEQLDRFVNMDNNHPPISVAFHKRYDIATEYLRADLPIHREPVSYHCVVHEVTLPMRHWYRWPNVGSRILSNGVHWIDHFLFLNNYCRATRVESQELSNGEIHCAIELENDSVFSMILSDVGSNRIGTRERVTINAAGHTATLVDFATYIAEDSRRVIRKASIDKFGAYERMYPSILHRLSDGQGDSLTSLVRTAEVSLALDAQISNR